MMASMAPASSSGLLSARFADALAWAAELHCDQTRKGTAIPYISHLLAVTALVLEHGADEDEAIAALLHDAVEDQGGVPTLAEIRRRFGDRVADIVDVVSDTDVVPKPPWRERKEGYLHHLADPTTPTSALLVSAADKLHNARSILTDLQAEGDQIWSRFNAGPEEQLWYYRSLVDILSSRLPGPLTDELASVVGELEHAITGGGFRPRDP
jgi:(p)ppGpp synthase/HD superfamily hydrolase